MPEIVIPFLQYIAGPLIAIIFSYLFARKKNQAEVKKLEGEKKSVEAAAGLSTAEAASIISRAAADVVQPLTNRIRELQEDSIARSQRHAETIRRLESHIAEVTRENVELKTKVAHLEAKVALLSKPSELANETSKRLGES